MALCRTCYGEYAGDHVSQCPRCKSDLNGWKQELAQTSKMFGYPPLRNVLLAFVAVIVVALFLVQPFHLTRSLVAIVLAAIPAFVLYSSRYGLRVARWLRQVRPRPGLSATHMQIGMMVFAIALAVATATLGQLWAEEELEIVQKVTLYVLLGLTCVGLSVSLTLTVVLAYGRALDDRVPQPIFVDMNRLAVLAVEAARKQLGAKGLETAAIQRMQDGGLKINVEEKAAADKPEGEPDLVPQGRGSWVIVADRWGRLGSVLPYSKPQY
jgi:hypothetical protein